MTQEAALPVTYPYLIGVYLALNAVPDLFMFLDGPDCGAFKAEYIQGKHDLNSTLLNCSGEDRIVRPDVDVTRIVHDRTDDIQRHMRRIDGIPAASAIIHTSMPMATITGTQYDAVIRDIKPPLSKPVFFVPPMSLNGDWIDGFSNTLQAVAADIELTGAPRAGRVAVVGYAMDRNEHDHLANIAEMERLLEGVGLETVSVWPSGRPVGHLAAAGEAAAIISLPHGRAAARTLAARTGAALIETGIPFGFDSTSQWLRQIADRLEIRDRAETFIDAELRDAVPRVKWVVQRVFLGVDVLFAGDPLLFESVHDFMRELGCRPSAMAASAGPHHLSPIPQNLVLGDVRCLFDPTPERLRSLADSFRDNSSTRLVISSDMLYNFLQSCGQPTAYLPFGFSTYQRHALSDDPFLGYRGALRFTDRMANAVMRTNAQFIIEPPPR